MPEGPQIVFLREQIDHFIGQAVEKTSGNAKDIVSYGLKGKVLKDIKTFGKELLLCFPNLTVRIHLMLFGKYAVDSRLNRELRLGLIFESGEINFYACECRFIQQPLDAVYDWSIDVLNDSFDRNAALQKLLVKPNQLICEALLDQNILAGVGNKIKNEVLFQRQVHPESVISQIPQVVLKGLIDDCVKLSFEYLAWKQEGSEDEPWKVYKKNECLRDHIPLRKEKIGKSRRSCHYCDKCQKLYTI